MKIKTVRRTAAAAAVVGAAATGIALAPGAKADSSFTGPNGYISSSCSGSLINSGRLYSSNGTRHSTAQWRLYYSSSNGGTNCLVLNDNIWGSHDMTAAIRYAYNYNDGAKDSGVFANYAGASNLKNAAGRCIGITVSLTEHDGTVYSYNRESFHCG
ncbi:hypothetical protein FB554_3252 [Barrientosiimonas humi]|uniref:Peptidase inhibitor family I36 n=1 Tax=Barrientosiimonas humi TaxID=999931 RepID=A0A542WZD5_9MICO|nr:hypothetical protein [Barrientosiimonas humi]TQL28943.1 hypothetical protein FB554_3252 [Barrientosiimonas humi]CAG7571346.1 hypothetical protein BH39T_PBIAJDOK_00320 [Barrientosiimonas humi]